MPTPHDPTTIAIGAAANAIRRLLDETVLADLSMAVVAAEEGNRNAAAGSLICVQDRLDAAKRLLDGALALHASDRER